jgi:hypothetical protein
MKNCPFHEWYQEWSTYAARSGANDTTKMYTFQQALPQGLNDKLLGVTPIPTSLTGLVDNARTNSIAYGHNPAKGIPPHSNLKARACVAPPQTTLALTLQTPTSKVSKPRNSQRKKETNALRTTSVSTVAMPAISLASAAHALPEEAEEGDNRTDSRDSTNPLEPEPLKSERKNPLTTPMLRTRQLCHASTTIRRTISRF